MYETKVSARQHVRGDIIRKAIEKNGYFNERFSEVIIKTLEYHGIVFDAEHYYSLYDVERRMQKLLGKEISWSVSKLIEVGVRNQ
ncbi:hypothetical protein NTE_00210 [Candidatus Nitrososphaera evergladensis SR1]|uniref:Uncharacterized protein n=1 Tax=Candidatus Nitrososphaera evergladensis SR1 TaxID=1459636 RepID=A0A075MNB1_9ARCH|nr:hypothetical protein [Candidatus Nitrososphaera evergladensis]AIF82292.1 hypothetical protein NTE_00210 [Candidatus Nitrososphaera evergladensis SR1]